MVKKLMLTWALLTCSAFAATPSVLPKPPLAGALVPAPPGIGYVEVLTWTQSPTCSIVGVTCTNNVYSCVGTCTSGSTFTKIASSVTGTTYTDSAPAGAVVSYYVTAVATGGGWNATESGPSNVFTQTFPVAPPSSLSGSAQ